MKITLEQALQKGIEAHKAGRIKEAERYYTSILKAVPEHSTANHNMGVLAIGIGKVEQAIPFFKVAKEVEPTIPQFSLSYIKALIKLDRIVDAKEVLDQAKRDGLVGDAFDQIEKMLGKKEKGKVRNPVPNKRELPGDKFESIANLYFNGQYEEALHEGSKLLEQFPSSLNLYNIIGAANKGLGRLDDSIRAYLNALAIEPNFADAHYNIGVALKEQGKLEEAINSYNNALSIKPNYAKCYYNKGNALKELGMLGDAIEAYNMAVSINTDYAAAYYNMSLGLRQLGKLDAAIEACKKVIAIEPDHVAAYNNIGNSLMDRGKLNEAVDAYKKAVSIKPDFADAYNNMGSALKAQGKLDKAVNAYKKALCIDPDLIEAYWNLSGTANNISEAKQWVAKCLKANTEYLKAKLTMSALKFYEGDKASFNEILQSPLADHPSTRSFAWAFSLPTLPPLHFHRWAFFDHVTELSMKDRPFYEFGVWRGEAFRYLIKTFKKGYGFDTFEGLPEDWHNQKTGTYTSDGNVPKIKGGEFIVGKFEDTLPGFFAEYRPKASVINFDADLYSSTICALNYAKPVMDQHTILIFDEFLINTNWEQDEYKALEEFCSNNQYTYEVIAISFFTKQVAVKLIGV